MHPTPDELHEPELQPEITHSPLLIRYTPEVRAQLDAYGQQLDRMLSDTITDQLRRAYLQHDRRRARAVEMFTGRRPQPLDPEQIPRLHLIRR